MSKYFAGKKFPYRLTTWMVDGRTQSTDYARKQDAIGDYELLCKTCMSGKVRLTFNGRKILSQGV